MEKFTTIRKIYEQEVSLEKTDDVTTDQIVAPTTITTTTTVDNVEQAAETEKTENEQPTEGTPVKLFSKIFESREVAHIYHLQANGDSSFSAHNALNDYYDDIVPILDELIETYQGQYGILDGYDTIDTDVTRSKDKEAYFQEVAEYIKHARKCISVEDSHLHSIVDDVVILLYKTLYKIKFLK